MRSDVFRPLPIDPHQALKDAVIEAAKAWRQAQRTEKHLASAAIDLLQAADALTAAQNPPKLDPVEVFYEVVGDNLCFCSSETWKLCRSKPDECACRHYITRGLAAVEAARTAK